MFSQLKCILLNLFSPKMASYCQKCGGTGWLFGFELDVKPDRTKIDSKVCCDHCDGSGFSCSV